MAMDLSEGEMRTLKALVDLIFPGTTATPGAVEIGAADYIATALAGAYAVHLPEYRSLIAALDAAAGGEFGAVSIGVKRDIMTDFEAGTLAGLPPPSERPLFDLVWRHVREGLFGDPAHGGNQDFAGWKAIGFPGAQFGYRADEQTLGHVVDRPPASFVELPNAARLAERPVLRSASSGSVSSDPEADVVIVGGGMVGGMLAWQLLQAGKKVVILEAGPARSGRERAMDEIQATAFRNVGGAAKFNSEVPTWRRTPHETTRRATMSQGLETALGGNSVAWGAVAMRFYEDDFRIRSATIARYGADRIPAGSTLADWPLSYTDLAPFYDLAEDVIGVSGDAGPSGNPFAAPRARAYAMPALRTSGLGKLFADAARAEGYHPFPLPAAILTAPYRGRHACTYCSFCSRFGCHVDAKASVQNTVLAELQASDRVTIVTGARVSEVVTDESGRAVGVRYRTEDGETRFQGGGTIVLSTYAFENTRLLLLSRTKRHARGLGNETGHVGGHYMTRQQPSIHALFEGQRLNRFIGPTAQAMAIADLSADHFDHAKLDFIRGGRIAAFNQYLPVEATGNLPPDVPRWGEAWRDFVLSAYNSTALLFIDPEILPYEANRLDLDPDVTDDLGRPVIRITFDIGENERRLMAYLQDRAEGIASRMGATRIWRRPFLTGPISTHDVGGTRMGHDPRTSVVDSFGRVHDTPGLVVLGGSTFVSLPAVNPALTIMALALRAGVAIGDGASALAHSEVTA
jgi:gluconate 2-dehydrogenase alpha chain